MNPVQRWVMGICAGLSLFLGVAGLVWWQEKVSVPQEALSLPVQAAPILPVPVDLPKPESVQTAPWPEPAPPEPAQVEAPSSSDSSEPDRSKKVEQEEIAS